jgi:DNA-binding response OmpR family regulator
VTILIVEDQADILEIIVAYLERESYRCETATDGLVARSLVQANRYDLVILDWMLPGLDGLELCRLARAWYEDLPILMVSARGQDQDRIAGLQAGVDDFLPKPFHPRELVSRVRALLRRSPCPSTGGLQVDEKLRQVSYGGERIALTSTELSLMLVFAARPEATLSRQELLDLAWGTEFPGSERTVDSYVRTLRAKLAACAPGNVWIESVWGVGYRFSPSV